MGLGENQLFTFIWLSSACLGLRLLSLITLLCGPFSGLVLVSQYPLFWEHPLYYVIISYLLINTILLLYFFSYRISWTKTQNDMHNINKHCLLSVVSFIGSDRLVGKRLACSRSDHNSAVFITVFPLVHPSGESSMVVGARTISGGEGNPYENG